MTGMDEAVLRAPGGPVGRLRLRGRWEHARTALLWLPGMFDNSTTRTTSSDDDVRRWLVDRVAVAELDYPSHLTPRAADVVGVRTEHLLSLIDQAVTRLTTMCPGVELTVVGHSMGAKLALLSCLRRDTIGRTVILDGWLTGAPEDEPVQESPGVLELFGQGARFKSMCAAIVRDERSAEAGKFYGFVLGMLERSGMLGTAAATAAAGDTALRERTFHYLSHLDPLWSGAQKDEMSRLAHAGPAALRERWSARRERPLRVLAINSGSRPEWYDVATDRTIDALDPVAGDRVRLPARGHLDLLFGQGSGVELGEAIVEWLWRGGQDIEQERAMDLHAVAGRQPRQPGTVVAHPDPG
jgi:pimeloyl-ACP methyl ester carboxylesterase